MRHLLSVPRLASRAFSTTVRQMKNKVPDRQKVFQCVTYFPLRNIKEDFLNNEDNGLPIHIKGGTTDVLLYRLTMTITIAGTGFSFYWLLLACMPKS